MAGERWPPDVCGLGGCTLLLMKFYLVVAPREGDAHPLGALPVGTLVNSVESEPGRGAQYIRAAGMEKAVWGRGGDGSYNLEDQVVPKVTIL